MHSTYPGKKQPYPPQMTRYLDPVLLARLLTTLDVLGNGRLDVGVGLGWRKDEHDIARSADWYRRGEMLGDLLAFLHAWWTTTPVSWDSEFFSLPPVHADLRPVQAGGPPIWIGGASEAAMRINLEPGTSVDSLAGKLARFAGSGVMRRSWMPSRCSPAVIRCLTSPAR
jgi:Luciferase-like monooxygenase